MPQKFFDSWNKRKKLVNIFEVGKNFYYHEREIWWCSLGVNIGVETDGKHQLFERPVLILKKFNKDMLWVLPLTSREHNDPFHHPVGYQRDKTWVKITQLRTVDSKRLLRKLGTIDVCDFEIIKKLLCGLITSNPAFGAGFSEAEATNTETINQ